MTWLSDLFRPGNIPAGTGFVNLFTKAGEINAFTLEESNFRDQIRDQISFFVGSPTYPKRIPRMYFRATRRTASGVTLLSSSTNLSASW